MTDNDRYRNDPNRFRDRDDDGRGGDDRGQRRGGDTQDRDDGFIARRGFGNERSGFERGDRHGGSHPDPSREAHRGSSWQQGYGHDGDFGGSAGHVGSSRGSRDAMGEERSRGTVSTGTRYDPARERGYGPGRNYDNTGSSSFGRGSREEHDERGFLERAGEEIRSWFGDDDRQGSPQHHRGRGPRNYARSDDRIREDVNDRLTDDPHIDASDIEVSVSGREVTLSGHVANRFEKRHAEDIAESVSGVAHVQNNLRVRQQNALAGMGGSSSTMTSDMGANTSGATTSGDRGESSSDPDGSGGGPRRTPAI